MDQVKEALNLYYYYVCKNIKQIIDKILKYNKEWESASTMSKILCGGSLCLNECTRLRVQDFDFERSTIMVPASKGDKNRQTLLPETLIVELQNHLHEIRQFFEQDRKANIVGFHMPGAMDKKYPTVWRRNY